MNPQPIRWALATGALLGLLAVAMGAFGAHGLKKVLTADQLAVFETAVKYQMYHALLLVCLGLLQWGHSALRRWSARATAIGVAIFSGSLYLYVATGVKAFGMITPIGGVLLMAGWALLALAALRR